MPTYRVSGPFALVINRVRHEPGVEIEAEFTDAQEARLLNAGSLQRLPTFHRRKRGSVKRAATATPKAAPSGEQKEN